MNMWTCILLMCGVTAYEEHDYYNVGTVLFSHSDLQRKYWSEREVKLLDARRYFQELLPPPHFITSQSNGIHSLFEYFKDSYSTVKRHSNDPQTDNIMTAALSDVFGGYLKLWALPITKFSYYGGTASQDDALKIHDLYSEIKSYLNTNGNGWRNPNPTLLSGISIKVAPPQMPNARGTESPCDTLAFFEKTKSGYSIPLPKIEWQKDEETMFLPLKSDFLVPLSQPIKPDPLLNYYNTAKNCITDKDVAMFEKNFQDWLSTQVIPHLNDEKLYPALGSVLSLVNKTTNLCDTVVDLYAEKNNSMCTRIFGMPVNLSSKKVIFMIVIIILEIAWCIPALCYLMCSKYKKRKDKYKNVYMVIKKDNKMGNRVTSCETTGDTRYLTSENSWRSQGMMYPSPEDACLEKGLSITYGRKARETNPEKRKFLKQLMNSNIHQDIKIGFSKKTGPNTQISHATTTYSNVNSNDLVKSEEIDPPETSPLPEKNLDKSETVTLLKAIDDDKQIEFKIDQILRYEKDTQIFLPATTSKGNQSVIEKSSKTTMVFPETKPAKPSKEKLRKKYVTMAESDPYLEITIDNRPRETIAFNIGHCTRDIDRTKPSKIPKRKFSSSEAQTHKSQLQKNVKKVVKPPGSRRRSFIPQPKIQRTMDDLNLNVTTKVGRKDSNKLNTTI